MIDARQLAKAFGRNTTIIALQAAGLSHEDSLLQTGFNVNCLNWTVGHILANRQRTIVTAGGEPTVTEGTLDRYQRESQPITGDGSGVLPLDELLAGIEASQERLNELLGEMSDEAFAAEEEIDGQRLSVARRVHFDYFHDTYHTGQTELLRQVAGTNDKLI
jgi:hypothetical protein